MSDRLPFPRAELRRRTVRGAMVTAGFLVGIDLLVLIQGLVVTRLLGPAQIGLYGVVSTTVISLIAILLATLNVNIGANVVSPANDFSNLWPRRISFRTGGVITCFMGIALMPWKLLADYKTFILGWLGGYAAFLGPVAGIMICDYFVVRRRVLQVDDLYLRGGMYEYSNGFNWRAVIALALGAGTALVGLAVSVVRLRFGCCTTIHGSWALRFPSLSITR